MIITDTNINFLNYDDNADRRIMLFDLAVGGHHSTYIRYLVKYWHEQGILGSLYIVISPQFVIEHADVVKSISKDCEENIKFIPITQNEYLTWKNQKNYLLKIVREWHLFCKYSKNLRSSHSLLLYFDHFQLSIFLGLKSPCPFSGIYFRPTFHYNEFDNYIFSWQDRFRQWRQKLILSRVLCNPQLKTIFSLDPFAVKSIKKLTNQVNIFSLPDPVTIYTPNQFKANELKAKIAINDDRKICLLFGKLNSRKGVYQLLDAISLLPFNLCKKLCLLIVGDTSDIEKIKIENQIAKIRKSLPIQIISYYQFIPESEVNLYFQIADIILAPYQRHVGMSGILLLAAAANKPVLASNYGLMGEITRRYELGLTVDSTKPQLIAKELTRCLLESPDSFCNFLKMKQFLEENDAKKFSDTLFRHIN